MGAILGACEEREFVGSLFEFESGLIGREVRYQC